MSSARMRVTKKEPIYEGKVVKLMKYLIDTPDGEQIREVIEHRGAVAMLAFTKPDTILLEYRYRPALDAYLYELPAGVLKPGEDPVTCAKRELLEETGYEAGKIEYLGYFYPTPGYTNEKIHIVIATELTYKGKPQAEMSPEEKYMEIKEVTLQQALQMILKGEITDGKTIIGILLYLQKKK